MKRMLLMAVALVLVVMSTAGPAKAETRVGLNIQIGDPYRGTSISFRSEPDVILVPSTKVYYVDDYDADLYRYGRFWYFVEEGRWYRAKRYSGPFYYIHATSVPRSVSRISPRYRRNWNGPPRHAAANGYYKNKDKRGNRDRDYDRNRDRGNGRGR